MTFTRVTAKTMPEKDSELKNLITARRKEVTADKVLLLFLLFLINLN